MRQKPRLAVVDDDESVRESLPDLLREFGYHVEAFCSAKEYLASPYLDITDLLLLDIAMPEMTGPELARELTRLGKIIPTIFITANRDVPLVNSLLGTVPVLMKPFGDAELRDYIESSLDAYRRPRSR
jgi:FixJ family two-component response regulator